MFSFFYEILMNFKQHISFGSFFRWQAFLGLFFFTFLFHPPTQLQTFIPFAKLKLKRKLRTLNFHFIEQHKEILSGAEKSKKKKQVAFVSYLYRIIYFSRAEWNWHYQYMIIYRNIFCCILEFDIKYRITSESHFFRCEMSFDWFRR